MFIASGSRKKRKRGVIRSHCREIFPGILRGGADHWWVLSSTDRHYCISGAVIIVIDCVMK